MNGNAPGAPALNSHLDSRAHEVNERHARLAARCLEAPVALVVSIARGHASLRGSHGLPAGDGPALDGAFLDRIRHRHERDAAAVVIDDPAAGLDTPAPVPRSWLSVPLLDLPGRIIGALVVGAPAGRVWTERHVAILTDLAVAAASEMRCDEDGARYRAVYEDNPFPMWVFDTRTHRFLSVNDAAVGHYGYSREEFLDMTIFDIRPPADAGALREEIRHGIAPGRQDMVRRHRRKDGVVFDVEVMTSRMTYDGHPARFVIARDVTTMRRNEDRYRQLVETAHEGVWTVDVVGVTTYVNARLCEMLGYDVDEIIGRQLFDFLEPESAFEARTLFARRQRGIAEVQEMALRRRDGTTFMALASISPIMESGTFVGALALLTDITERRRVENALRESQELLAAAEELAHTGSWAIDLATDEVVWSDQLYRIVGLPPGSPVTRADFLGLVHPDDRAIVETEFQRLISTGDADAIQLRAIRPDGMVRIIQARGRLHRTPDGLLTVLGSVQDVTDRAAALAEIERVNRQLATVVNGAPLPIVTIDQQGRVTSWNAAAEQLFGWSADEVLGKPMPNIPEGRRAEFEQAIVDRLQLDRNYAFETQRLRKDGTVIDVEIATAPVRDASGAIVGGMGFYLDVTQRKHLEAQLRQAQKIEAVGQLAGGIAHDFNNIITAIKLHSEFLLESIGGGDPRRDDVEEVRKAAVRAAGLTRQLLAFSRKQMLKPVVLDLNETVRELQKMIARLIGEDIAVCADLAADLHPVLADPGQVEQVLINLAVNARDAMPDGGRIVIHTENVVLDGDYTNAHPVVATGRYVMLSVRDTGCGMTREIQSRVFEPFFTTKGPRRGTGLGLSTVYGIVQQSNGLIAVRSAPGAGTTFMVYLPAAAADGRATIERAVVPAAGRGSEVVLLVEDEEGVRALARRILARQGYIVLEATDGRHALEVSRAHEGRIDIVVTDAVMPEMNGIDLIREIRLARPKIRVLLMSGYTDDEMTRRGLLTPDISFLPKPFDLDDLLRRVRDVLDGSAAGMLTG